MKKIAPVLLLLVFTACKKQDTTASLAMYDYPFNVGDSWTYLVTNYPNTQADTAVFTIVAEDTTIALCAPATYETQTTIKGVVVDSGLVSIAKSLITYVGDNGHQTFAGSGLFDEWELKFPLQAHSSWGVDGGAVQVQWADQTLTIQGITYNHVYTLVRTTITPGGTLIDTMLVAPQIGIIKCGGFPLLSYHLQ